MNQKVVVTGASGHIGFHVAKLLCEQEFDVHLLIRSVNSNVERLQNNGATIHIVDLHEANTFRDILRSTSALFHLASENTTDTSDEERVLRNTVGLTKSVLSTAVEMNVKAIIYTSSVVVLGRSPNPNVLITQNNRVNFPESPYVKGKLLAEEFCDSLVQQGVDIRRMYPSWVVGSFNAKLTPPHKIIQDVILKGQPFYFDGGISVADVHEVAKAHINAWINGKPKQQYVLGGNNISFYELYSTIATFVRKSSPKLKIPKFFIYVAAQILKVLLGKKSPVDPKYVQSIIGNFSWYDSSKAISELEYKIPPLNEILLEGIKEVRFHLVGLSESTNRTKSKIIKKTKYNDTDILLITGFPGWLANRMVDIFINGNRNGEYAIKRKIRLLVLPSFKDLRIELPDNFEIVYGDLQKRETLSAALKNVTTVYHCAGVIYPPKIQTLYDVNWTGTKNLVDACIENGVKRILYMGTDSICGYGNEKRTFDEFTSPNPYKNYGNSKYLAEQYILQKTKEGFIQGTSLRGFWFFGPYMPLRNQSLIKMLKWKRQIIFGTGKNYRSLTHIDNVVQAFVKAEKESKTFGKWYWISDKNYLTTVDEIFKIMAKEIGEEYRPLYIPNILCSFFSAMDTIIGKFGLLNATIHAAGKFNKDIAGDHTAAQRDFKYEPIDTFTYFKDDIENIAL